MALNFSVWQHCWQACRATSHVRCPYETEFRDSPLCEEEVSQYICVDCTVSTCVCTYIVLIFIKTCRCKSCVCTSEILQRAQTLLTSFSAAFLTPSTGGEDTTGWGCTSSSSQHQGKNLATEGFWVGGGGAWGGWTVEQQHLSQIQCWWRFLYKWDWTPQKPHHLFKCNYSHQLVRLIRL